MENRNSNIELMRIFAIFFITLYHNRRWGGYSFENNNGINELVLDAIANFGKIGVNIFAITTAFFGADSFKLNVRKILNVEMKTLFVSWTLGIGVAGYVVINSLDVGEYLTNIKSIVFPIIFEEYWYVTAYIILMLLAPYLNGMLYKLEICQFRKFLVTVFIIWSVIPMVTLRIWQNPYGIDNYVNFLVIYAFGVYLRRIYEEGMNEGCKERVCIVGYLAIGIQLIYPILVHLLFPTSERLVTFLRYGNSVNSVFLTIFIFEKFRSHFFYNKYINKIAGNVFCIYLIQEHIWFRK